MGIAASTAAGIGGGCVVTDMLVSFLESTTPTARRQASETEPRRCSSHAERHPSAAGISSAGEAAGLGIDRDGVDAGDLAIALGEALDGVAAADFGADVLRDAGVAVGPISLAVEARRQDRVADAHPEFQHVQDDLQI